MVARTPRKFRIGSLTEDDLDQDYAPGRSEGTMSPEHVSALDALVERTRRAADKIEKSTADKIIVVLERE